VGDGDDAGQVDDRLGAVAPISRGVSLGFGQESFGMVHTDGLGGDSRMGGELSDGQHPSILGLPLPLRQGCTLVP